MAEIKKMDFRSLETQGQSQPEKSAEINAQKGLSSGPSFGFWERMTKKSKTEVVILIVVLLMTVGVLFLFF